MRLAWSDVARREGEELRRYSVGRWGREVARAYLADVRDAAKLVAGDVGRARTLKGPYRIFRVRSHYLILRVDVEADRVTVARLLHVAMDIWRHLP